jgi:hypothetical protein
MLKIGSRTYRKKWQGKRFDDCESCAFDMSGSCARGEYCNLGRRKVYRETFLSRFRAALRDEIARDYPYDEHDTMGR